MSETTRERILYGALELISTNPSRELDMQQLADWVGVSRKTIYNHFPGKTELISQAVAMGMDRIVRSLQEIADDPDLTFVERLDRIIEEGFRESSRLLSPGGTPGVGVAPPGIVGGAVRELNLHIRDLVRRIATEADGQGLLDRSIDPETFTHVVLSLVGGALSLNDTDALPCMPLQLLRESFRILLTGALSDDGAEALKGIGILAGREAAR